MTDSAVRTPTAVDALADRHLERLTDLDPAFATFSGVAGHDDALPDYSADWYDRVADLARTTLTDLDATAPVDVTDRVTAAALRERLSLELEIHDRGLDRASLNVIDSPVQSVQMVFDLMPTATAQDWATVARRAAAVPQALAGYTTTLRDSAAAGQVVARRQVISAATQCDDFSGPDGFFAALAARPDVPQSVRADLEPAAAAAGEAYAGLGRFLRDELAGRARDHDPVGREVYALRSRSYLGTAVDLDATYEWGQQELDRIIGEQAATAERIRPGASVAQAREVLDADPDRRLDGTEALRRWMQRTSDEALAALAGTHFDIPDEIRTLECCIAPSHSGGVYYTGPSEDLTTRPGRMWWSVPEGVTEFTTWRERTTVYHEGVPGHHLQIGQTTYRRDLLNRWRRLGTWVPGYGEGWALYAERLMADLGFLDDPADYLGMLDGQSLRAARVVLDIGIHCELPAPSSVGGGAWDYDKAWTFLTRHSSMAPASLRFELDRYLGWPGQAPSYKIGEREWLSLREDARAAEGDAFDLRAFHRRALDAGPVGLDLLRAVVLGTI